MSLRIAYGKLKQYFNLHTLPQARVYIGSEFSADGDLKPAFGSRIKPQACIHVSDEPASVLLVFIVKNHPAPGEPAPGGLIIQ